MPSLLHAVSAYESFRRNTVRSGSGGALHVLPRLLAVLRKHFKTRRMAVIRNIRKAISILCILATSLHVRGDGSVGPGRGLRSSSSSPSWPLPKDDFLLHSWALQ